MHLRPLLLLPLLLPACSEEKKDAVWWENEKQIIELRNEIDLARYRTGIRMDAPALPTGAPHHSDLSKDIESLSTKKSLLSARISALESGWEDFRTTTLDGRRNLVIGKTFETFETASGKVYEDVTVSRIDDAGVSLRHKSGTARLRFHDLDESRQEFFGLDGELAFIALGKERKKREAYERRIEKGLALAKIEETRLADIRREEERQKLASSRALSASRRAITPSALTASVGNLGDTRTIYSSRRYSSYGSYGRPRTRYYYTYSNPPSRTRSWNASPYTYHCKPAATVNFPAQSTANPFNP